MTSFVLGREARSALDFIWGISRYEQKSISIPDVLNDAVDPAVFGTPSAEDATSATATETLVVTRDLKILIVGRGVELVMRPLPKMLFLLFLKHPEGINFKDMSLYEEEMASIYARLSHRLDNEGMRRTIGHIFNVSSNSLNTQRSALTAILSRYFPKSTVGNYVISGARGLDKTILLDRAYVRWEADI